MENKMILWINNYIDRQKRDGNKLELKKIKLKSEK